MASSRMSYGVSRTHLSLFSKLEALRHRARRFFLHRFTSSFLDSDEAPIVGPPSCPHPLHEFLLFLQCGKEANTSHLGCWNFRFFVLGGLRPLGWLLDCFCGWRNVL